MSQKKTGDAYLDTVSRMEPDIAQVDAATYHASAAISLKRIADAMEERNRLLQGLMLSNALDTLKPGGPAVANGPDIARHGGELNR